MPQKSPGLHPATANTKHFQVDIDDSQIALQVDHQHLKDVVRQTLAAEQCESAIISVALVDNETIHDLNRRYLRHDFETDVLSFLLDSELANLSLLPIPPDAPRGTGKRLDGEIIVSVEMACQTAEKYHWRPEDELTLYVVHGLLHLCGYDDRSEAERRCMRQREHEVLQLWNLIPHYADE